MIASRALWYHGNISSTFLLMAVARFNLYIKSFMVIFNFKSNVKDRKSELIAIAFFWVWYIGLIVQIPSVSGKLLVLFIPHAVAGIVHVQLTLFHFSMPTHHGTRYDSSSTLEWLKAQILTTMNIESLRWMDWFHGGLQYQIEHHLFPKAPRHHLRHIKYNYVKPFCEKHDIAYTSVSFGEAIARVYRRLKKVALLARKTQKMPEENYLKMLLDAEG